MQTFVETWVDLVMFILPSCNLVQRSLCGSILLKDNTWHYTMHSCWDASLWQYTIHV